METINLEKQGFQNELSKDLSPINKTLDTTRKRFFWFKSQEHKLISPSEGECFSNGLRTEGKELRMTNS